ncbi:MAG: CheR family methyltransferase [Bacteroidota bacterium]
MAKAKKEDISAKQFPIVGIGASAGGLDAVKTFLKALPANPGMAFVFIQHLSPTHESILPEILQKVAPFPVQQITDNIHLEPDNLYIIPQNKIVTTTDGILKLTAPDKNSKKSNTIDLFFSSLGVVHQSYAVGIVLSGALNDGSLGLQVIKSYGGLTFAQDEGSAAFDSMPRSAVQAGGVDFVLPPEQIAQHLIDINHPFTDYTPDQITDTIPQQDNETFKQILTVLRVRRGVDFAYYKQSTLKRRIIRRMALNKIERPIDYLFFLRENKSEQDALYNDMLISVTNFFRDPPSFEVLCSDIFPALINNKTDAEPLRIWIAGCATGEEAYSMAICLQEILGDKTAAIKIQIFATDISETAIAKARTGIYRATELTAISASRLQQFFTKLDGNYQVNKTIRDMCVFAHHNLLKDPPFSKIDLVSCRNVMIYLEPVLQKRALTTFNYSLNEGGYLMLGKSETIGSNTDIFAPYNSTEKLYRRKGPLGRFMTVSSPGRERTFREIDKIAQKDNTGTTVFKIADEAMLINFMPAGVLVNDKFDIVQFRGSTEMWLTPPIGRPSFNLLKMAREGLAFELRNMLHAAKKTNSPVRKFNLFFKNNDLQHFVNVQVLKLQETVEEHYLIVFQPASSTGIQPIMFENTQASTEAGTYNASEIRIEQLERELIQTRADMRIVSEEQESANEELQSANEELLSGSEELQSLNEELETSKEELQSTNEEVLIINKELVDRNEQLNTARLYTEGIVNTIRDPLIILDKDLRVKRATGGFYTKFKLTEAETEGAYIYELGNHQWDIPALRELLEEVLPAKKALADIEVTQTFPVLGTKTLCLNAREIDNIHGEKLILLAIEDITAKRKIEDGLVEVERLLSESKERLKFAVDSAGVGTWDYNPQIRELIWDKRCKEIFDLPPSRTVDIASFFDLIHANDIDRVKTSIKQTLTDADLGEFDLEFRTIPINGKPKWLKAKGRAYFNEAGEAMRFIGTLLDITVQKLIDEATRDLLNKKDEFISIASHELKTPITSLKACLQMVERITSKTPEMKLAHSFIVKGLKQVDKLVELIKDLLEVTKIQAGKLELNKTRFILDDLIKECCEDLQVQSDSHSLIIEGEQVIAVYADRNRMEQVIINLISNAVKYSPGQDKVTITVSGHNREIKIAITDLGIGIPKDKLPFLFDRFYRVDDSSQRYSGLGLGLYISAEIVRRHDGVIGIESRPGEGSTFWFTIPEAS